MNALASRLVNALAGMAAVCRIIEAPRGISRTVWSGGRHVFGLVGPVVDEWSGGDVAQTVLCAASAVGYAVGCGRSRWLALEVDVVGRLVVCVLLLKGRRHLGLVVALLWSGGDVVH